jgi:hypothetical protein
VDVIPAFWDFMMRHLFRVTNPRLIAELWQTYPKSQTLIYQCDLCGTQAATPLDALSRVKHLVALLDPATLMQTAEKLAAPGKPRPKELIAFEEAVLHIVQDGHWKW